MARATEFQSVSDNPDMRIAGAKARVSGLSKGILGAGGPSASERQLRIIYLARALVSASRAIAAIGVPVYLAARGFSASKLGLIFALGSVFSLIISFVIGATADRHGRKVFLVAYPLLVAVASFVFAFTTSDVLLAAMAIAASFGRGAGAGASAVGPYQPAETALVADLAHASGRSKAFSRITQMSILGSIAGSGVSVVAFGGLSAHGHHDSFMPAFLIAGIFVLVGGLVALALADDRPADTKCREHKGVIPKGSIGLLGRLWITNTLNGFAVGMFGPFVTYFLYRKFGAPPSEIALLYLVVNLVTLGPVGRVAALAAHFGNIRVTVALRLIQAILLIPFAYAPVFWAAGAIFLMRTLAQRSALPLRQSYVQAMSDPDERARVAALSNIPSQAALVVSPAISGYLFEVASLEIPFFIGGILQFVSTIFYWAFFANSPPPEERPDL